jgi:PAS domain-containing protein
MSFDDNVVVPVPGGTGMEDAASAVALRESEELHRITLLNMSDAVFITTDDGVFSCPNVDVIFGYGQDEVRTMNRVHTCWDEN